MMDTPPFRFEPEKMSIGHTMLIGATGTGKTVPVTTTAPRDTSGR